MSKIKIHEYAKQIGKPAKELVTLLQESGVDVKSHMSNIDDAEIKVINKKYGISSDDSKEEKPVKKLSRLMGGRPSSARSVGTAAAVIKEVEKAEKAREKEEKKKIAEAAKETEDSKKKDTEKVAKSTKKIEEPVKVEDTKKQSETKASEEKKKNVETKTETTTVTKDESKADKPKIEETIKKPAEIKKSEETKNATPSEKNVETKKVEDTKSIHTDKVVDNKAEETKKSDVIDKVATVTTTEVPRQNQNSDTRRNDGQNNYNRDGQRNNRDGQNNYNRDGQNNYNRDGQRGNRDGQRGNRDGQQGGYNRDGQRGNRDGQQGNYNRDGQRNYNRDGQQGSYNRDGQRGNRDGQQGNYNRDGQRSYNRDGQQGNFNRDGQQGNYNRDGQRSYNRDGQQGSYNKDGQRNYNRDGQQNNYNRDGQRNFNRDGQQGGYNKDGQRNFNRDGQQGGYNRDGQRNYNRDGQQGGYNRDGQRNGQQGGYNRDGQKNGQQGGYNRNGQQGGYNRNGQQGGYNRNGQQGGYNKDGQRNGQGGYNKDDNRGQRNSSRDGRDNRDNRNNNKGDNLSSAFATPAASKSSLEVGRSGRANWTNRKNTNDDYKYADEKENFDALNKTVTKNKKKKDVKPKAGAFIKPEVVAPEPDDGIKTIILPEILTIKELADKIKVQPSALVKKLFLAGKIVTINQEITFEEAGDIALEYNCIAEQEEKVDVIAEILKEDEEDETTLSKRPPVVCVMGHVDHGKTSLLDAIRETNVTSREAGGITQHIGAYVVEANGEKITFLDTPGHEAFTSMRMRGAKSTDIAILVVAADDGVMPQTVEAISHAKAAGIQIIVAINKIDKPSANIERVKNELTEYELVAEDWGGDTIFVPVSAHTKEGIDTLLEMILLTAEMCELKANPDRKARGLVIEAELDKGRGPVATVLVQKGTLNVGDSVAIGSTFGKVRAMIDDNGRRVKLAGPSTPVEILGLNDVPNAGEILMATENEKEARGIADAFIKQGREKLLEDTKHKLSLDGLFSQIKAGEIKELNIIVKADVQGSVEAVKQSLLKLSNEEVAVRIIHGGVGAVNESDVILASASNAIIIGFNVRPDNQAKDVAEREKVDLRLYKVIYNAIEDVEAAMKGMLDPVYEEVVIGHAEIRQIFKASGLGSIAGSYVLDGKIVKDSKVRITREGELVFEGPLASLKRFKDDVKEVKAGFECGLVFEKFNDIKEEDQVEAYIMQEVPR